MLDLIIIGAGPAGIHAAYMAQKFGLKAIVFEKDRIGQSWRRMFKGMTLLSPGHEKIDWTSLMPEFPIWKLPVGKPFQSAEEFVGYLEKIADNFKLNIMERAEVVDIALLDKGFRVYLENFHMDSKCIAAATGVFHNPYYPDIFGIHNNPHVIHAAFVHDTAPFKGKKIAIIGAGNSGVELAVALSGEAEVLLMCRDTVRYYSQTGRIFDVRGLSESIFKELVYFKIINCHEGCYVRGIEGGTIHLEDMPSLSFDKIILATGYRAALPPIMGGIMETDEKGFPITTNKGESVSINGLFFVGAMVGTERENAFIHGYREKIMGTVMEIREKLYGPMMPH